MYAVKTGFKVRRFLKLMHLRLIEIRYFLLIDDSNLLLSAHLIG